MKKLVVATFMLLFSISLFADIDVGEFTWGEWLDPNYNAIWSIRNSNVRILDLEGGVYYNFDGKTIRNLSVTPTTEGLAVSFFVDETQKAYTLIQPLTGRDIILRIERDGFDDYEVTMPFQPQGN
jgi:hypothetical protein